MVYQNDSESPKPVAEAESLVGVVSTDLFASDIDDETYVIRDKSGQQKMLMTRKPGSKWKLYALIDSDQYRNDLMERHGISYANVKTL